MNKKVVFLILIITLIAFYLFIIRPAQIRKNCYNYAAGAPIDMYDYYYKACLNKNGL